MSIRPKHTVIDETNTRVWLRELLQEYRKPADVATVPKEGSDAVAAHGVDAVATTYYQHTCGPLLRAPQVERRTKVTPRR